MIIHQEGSGILSSEENPSNYQRSYYFTNHPRWINLPHRNKPNVPQKICVTKVQFEENVKFMKQDLQSIMSPGIGRKKLSFTKGPFYNFSACFEVIIHIRTFDLGYNDQDFGWDLTMFSAKL